ncbi:MAG: hypothetical protein H0T76_13275 [Nannocystis sp.]|nr:hypothetical protein [Nannocystis sp.]MBA3547452.1 hypothetical protein [Nannocystis sp.]
MRAGAGATLVLTTAVLTACPGKPHGNEEGTGTGTSTSTGDTGEPDEIPAVCQRWVGCTAEIDPSTAAEMAAKYGEHGSCWLLDGAERAGCVAFCDNQLRSYGKAFPELMACRYDDIVGTAQFTLGEAVFDPADPLAAPTFRELGDGDELTIVRGGQGLLMLPLGVHGSGFEVPADPLDWDNARTPRIDLWIDIEGFNVGIGGHFTQITGYPIGFVPVGGDGTLEHLYITAFVPDPIADPSVLFGKPGVLRAELQTYQQPTVALELSFVVASELQEL